MPPTRRPAAPQHQAGLRSTRKAHILVVDDFRDNREMYADYLRFSGYSVDEAVNGREAVDKVRRGRPDLVVMDLSLPVLDGWQATRMLKTDPDTKHIPVIAVTGHALQGNEALARAAGVDAYLTKPCLPEKLAATIAILLGGKAAESTA